MISHVSSHTRRHTLSETVLRMIGEFNASCRFIPASFAAIAYPTPGVVISRSTTFHAKQELGRILTLPSARPAVYLRCGFLGGGAFLRHATGILAHAIGSFIFGQHQRHPAVAVSPSITRMSFHDTCHIQNNPPLAAMDGRRPCTATRRPGAWH